MRFFRSLLPALLSVGALALVGCGDDSGSSGPSADGIESCLGEFPSLPADFSAAGYAAANADLAAYFCTDGACDGKEECRALAGHYVNNGAAEGRGYVPIAPSSSAAAPSSASGQPSAKANRIGFYPYYATSYGASKIDFSRYTQINLFSILLNADGTLDCSALDDNRMLDVASSARNAGLKVFVSIGGDSRSTNMNTVFANEALRGTFVNAVKDYLVGNGYDGIDIDWEYPKSDAEAAGLSATLKALHGLLAPAGKLVSVDLPTHLHMNDGSAVIHADFGADVDQINVMTYDYVFTGYQPTDPLDKTIETMDYWRNAGLPANKLNIGMPFYGRNCINGSNNCAAISWYQYYLDGINGKWTWPKMPYFLSEGDRLAKVDYLASNGLAGVLYWAINQDVPLDESGFPLGGLGGADSVKYRLAQWWDEQLAAKGR